jgi:hypothetical protein
MNYCEYNTSPRCTCGETDLNDCEHNEDEVCGAPATVRIGGKWYCEPHADARELEIADENWAMTHKIGPYAEED